jgi:hypothetical protein
VNTFLIVAGAGLAFLAVAVLAYWFFRRRGQAAGEETFEGTFTFGWEVSSFVPGDPANKSPRYWLAWTPESRFMEQFKQQGYDPAWTPGYGSVRTRFVGVLEKDSSTGYGHMGQYDGQVTVLRVIHMSRAEPGD